MQWVEEDWRKRRPVINRPDRSSRFAPTRKGADFQVVIKAMKGLKLYEYRKAKKPKSEKRASVDYGGKWQRINWTVIETKGNRLQSRIAKAAREGRFNLLKILQYLLTKSYYAKLLAVKKVISNKGSKTPGVDGDVWNNDVKRYKGALNLEGKGYKASPLRRTYIKKPNGKLRTLGIPTMHDRSMQALYAMALDPVAESIISTRAFGFRKYRSCQDAQSYIHRCLCKKGSADWILEGDVKGCFDNISHQWLLDNVPMNKRILRQFLKAGFVQEEPFPNRERNASRWHHITDTGEPDTKWIGRDAGEEIQYFTYWKYLKTKQ